MSGTPAVTDRITAHFAPSPPARLGVAVSGGSDSLGLLIALHDWAGQGGPALHAVTVDHGLRPGSAAEAADVARICAALEVPHDRLALALDDRGGNLMARARQARYASLAAWAQAQGIADIALGHTADDLAETLLMRLSREAGLDGLAAMRARRCVDGVTFHRPLLGTARQELRDLLRARGQGWVEDPTNADPRFDRARARRLLETLAPLGITAPGLAAVARNLREARDALGQVAAALADDIVTFDAGDVLIAGAALRAQPADLQRRLLQAALAWVAGQGYAPRGATLGRALDAARAGRRTTLHGCHLLPGAAHLRICRELRAVAGLRGTPGAPWDGRWRLDHPDPPPGLHIAALGPAGLAQCPARRETGRPAASLHSGPAVWRGEALIAAPLAGRADGWTATLLRGATAYRNWLVSH